MGRRERGRGRVRRVHMSAPPERSGNIRRIKHTEPHPNPTPPQAPTTSPNTPTPNPPPTSPLSHREARPRFAPALCPSARPAFALTTPPSITRRPLPAARYGAPQRTLAPQPPPPTSPYQMRPSRRVTGIMPSVPAAPRARRLLARARARVGVPAHRNDPACSLTSHAAPDPPHRRPAFRGASPAMPVSDGRKCRGVSANLHAPPTASPGKLTPEKAERCPLSFLFPAKLFLLHKNPSSPLPHLPVAPFSGVFRPSLLPPRGALFRSPSGRGPRSPPASSWAAGWGGQCRLRTRTNVSFESWRFW